MTQFELTKYNVGRDLDELMNLDPRGYGVCRILYPASREYAHDTNVSMHFAEKLLETLSEGDLVYIITGFRLLPHGSPETDGIIGSMLLARTLAKLGMGPALIVPEQCIEAARHMASVCGLHFYTDIESVVKYPIAVCAVPFTTDPAKAKECAEEIFGIAEPKALVAAIEAPGANEIGVYHNATGLDITSFEAKADALFDMAKERKIPTFAIGDLGNEMGMGAIREHIEKYIPYAQKGADHSTCRCGCNGGNLRPHRRRHGPHGDGLRLGHIRGMRGDRIPQGRYGAYAYSRNGERGRDYRIKIRYDRYVRLAHPRDRRNGYEHTHGDCIADEKLRVKCARTCRYLQNVV